MLEEKVLPCTHGLTVLPVMSKLPLPTPMAGGATTPYGLPPPAYTAGAGPLYVDVWVRGCVWVWVRMFSLCVCVCVPVYL